MSANSALCRRVFVMAACLNSATRFSVIQSPPVKNGRSRTSRRNSVFRRIAGQLRSDVSFRSLLNFSGCAANLTPVIQNLSWLLTLIRGAVTSRNLPNDDRILRQPRGADFQVVPVWRTSELSPVTSDTSIEFAISGGLKARNVIAWAEASHASEGPGRTRT